MEKARQRRSDVKASGLERDALGLFVYLIGMGVSVYFLFDRYPGGLLPRGALVVFATAGSAFVFFTYRACVLARRVMKATACHEKEEVQQTKIGHRVPVICTALAVVMVFGVPIAHQIQRARLVNSILAKVDGLALYPPGETSELEWAVLIYWTHHLHNEARPYWYADSVRLRMFDRFLDEAVASGPSHSTIDWLWDRYASMSPSGSRYRVTHEPIRDEIANLIASEGVAYPDAQKYQSFLAEVKTRKSREKIR